MTCPFLKEAQVRYCRSSSVRKLIPLAVGGRAEEKCSSAEFVDCPVYRLNPEPASGLCPYLRESLMQYCAAAPVAKMVPYSESLLSRCGTDGYRYCELYLAMAHPAGGEEPDGIALPDWLLYSPNHMWVDVSEDGTCHVGIDAFLSRALGTIERVSYIWQSGRHCPAAVLTVAGTDLEVVFPNPLLLTKCNLYLRADPARVTREPYTGGWLFEGTPLPETTRDLFGAPEARAWMEQEQRRMNEFLQAGSGTVADGGLFAAGAARMLERERMLALFHEFFVKREL
jgi:glycine cleavage system H lipoate-binding protein